MTHLRRRADVHLPYTTDRLYRWVRPKKGNPMSDVLHDPTHDPEDETEEEEDEEDENESWETENGLIFEIVECPADAESPIHDEVLVVEEDEEGNQKDVAIALSIEDVDEAIDTLKEIRAEMVKRQSARGGAVVATPKPAAKTPAKTSGRSKK
jgi:hypothetical protein